MIRPDIFVTSNRKTHTNDFPRHGFFTRLPRGLLAACKVERMSGNTQPNGLSEIAHEWSKTLHGLKKKFARVGQRLIFVAMISQVNANGF